MVSTFRYNPPIIAHRGASADVPENTLTALAVAREQGASWLEFDVKLTSDGIPVLMHDDMLDRTTNGKGNVADTAWADIQKLDAGSWRDARFKGERVPHLTEALRFVLDKGMRLNLEVKPCLGRDRVTAMVAMIEGSKVWPYEHEPPLVSSFSEEALTTCMQLQPHWPRSFCVDNWQSGWRESLARIKAEAITIDVRLLTGDNLHALRQTGLAILAYTVNDAPRARDLLNEA